MKFSFTEEQEQMQAMVRAFAEEKVKAMIPDMESGHFPGRVIEEMGELGLMGIPIAKEYGGMGKGFIPYIIAIHELSKVSAAVGVILSVHTSVGTNPIVYFGREDQKAHYLPKLASGEYLGAFALTEPNAGSDASRLKLKATKKGETYHLNGSKIFITNGKEADTFITFARTNDQKGSKGISAFIIEKDTPGLRIGKEEAKLGLHGTSTTMLHFDDCKVKETAMLGEEGEGFRVAMANLNAGRIGIAAQALGIIDGTLDYLTNHYKQHSNISQSQLFKLADIKTKREAAALLVYQAASMMENDLPCIKEVSMAKLFTTKAAREITIDAISLIGYLATSEGHPLQGYFRDAKVTEIYEGTSEIQKVVISKQIL